jgi:hypothetical protein
VVRKRLKLKLISKKVNGNRIYQIASGESGSSRQAALFLVELAAFPTYG